MLQNCLCSLWQRLLVFLQYHFFPFFSGPSLAEWLPRIKSTFLCTHSPEALCVYLVTQSHIYWKVCIKITEIFFKKKCSVLIFLFLLLLFESEQHGGAPLDILRLPGKRVIQREKQHSRILVSWLQSVQLDFRENDFQHYVITFKFSITCLTSISGCHIQTMNPMWLISKLY